MPHLPHIRTKRFSLDRFKVQFVCCLSLTRSVSLSFFFVSFGLLPIQSNCHYISRMTFWKIRIHVKTQLSVERNVKSQVETYHFPSIFIHFAIWNWFCKRIENGGKLSWGRNEKRLVNSIRMRYCFVMLNWRWLGSWFGLTAYTNKQKRAVFELSSLFFLSMCQAFEKLIIFHNRYEIVK